MGPDVCGPGQMEGDSKCSTVDYFNSILTNTDGVLDAVVVHHYGIGDCNLKSFTSPFKVYQPQPKLLEWRRHKIDVYPRPTISMILGETATAGSGGCAELSNRFVAGFWWIFTLGELGVLRYDKVFRQNFV
ncbi:HPSE, partial [Symbiodinium microadriaticum]